MECVGGALCLLSLAGLEYAQYPQQARHGYTKLGLLQSDLCCKQNVVVMLCGMKRTNILIPVAITSYAETLLVLASWPHHRMCGVVLKTRHLISLNLHTFQCLFLESKSNYFNYECH